MSDNNFNDDHSLLEIEIIQLSNLFGDDPYQQNPGKIRFGLSPTCTDSQIEELNKLDIYRISIDDQREIFVTAAYQAFFGRQPTNEELARDLEILSASADGFQVVMANLRALSEEQFSAQNQNREKSIELTLDNIDRWAPAKSSGWRKSRK
jgi:hypothetical protein